MFQIKSMKSDNNCGPCLFLAVEPYVILLLGAPEFGGAATHTIYCITL